MLGLAFQQAQGPEHSRGTQEPLLAEARFSQESIARLTARLPSQPEGLESLTEKFSQPLQNCFEIWP